MFTHEYVLEKVHAIYGVYPHSSFIHIPVHPKTYSRSVPTDDEVAQTRCDVGEDPRFHRSVAFPKDMYIQSRGQELQWMNDMHGQATQTTCVQLTVLNVFFKCLAQHRAGGVVAQDI
jgi:hypothetical protein